MKENTFLNAIPLNFFSISFQNRSRWSFRPQGCCHQLHHRQWSSCIARTRTALPHNHRRNALQRSRFDLNCFRKQGERKEKKAKKTDNAKKKSPSNYNLQSKKKNTQKSSPEFESSLLSGSPHARANSTQKRKKKILFLILCYFCVCEC